MLMKEFREQEFSRKLEIASKTRFKGYEDEVIEEEDLVFYQVENKKAWLGPVKIFAIKGNAVFLFANGSMRKIPRCNVKLYRKKEDVNVILDGDQVKGVNSKNDETEDQSFGDGINEEDVKEIDRMRTRSMERERRRDLELDDVSMFWLKLENTECYDDVAVYTVEIPTKDQNMAEVMEAKEKELQNLFKYDVFKEIEDWGQERIASRWVITQKEKADGQM